MHPAAIELLQYYQKELRESEEGQAALTMLGITSPSVIQHYQLGYASGKAKGICARATLKALREIGLVDRKELFSKHIVLPVLGQDGTLVDFWGIRPKPKAGTCRVIYWHTPPLGLFGRGCLRTSSEVLLCESPIHALQLAQQGRQNVVAFGDVRALEREREALTHVERVYLYSRGLEGAVKECFASAEVVKMKLKLRSNDPVTPPAEEDRPARDPGSAPVELLGQGGGTISFKVGEFQYELDSQSTHINLRVQIRAKHVGRLYLDRCDLGSATSRRTFARGCASRLQASAHEIEEHLCGMVEALEKLDEEKRRAAEEKPRELSAVERSEAMGILQSRDLLDRQAKALQTCFGYVAEPENKRLALLVAASRLLDKPVAGIVRGPAASGKSALILAVSKIICPWHVLYFSRMTAQSLYFLPREQLAHKLLVCDEYEGLEDSEYALRTMMSNQSLSLAITVREGGRVPVTRTVEIPATVAVLVSTTQQVNIENLSRFIELRLDTSGEQTQRVLGALATGNHCRDTAEVERLRRASQLLEPCSVEIPYANKLVYQSSIVLARRQFAQVVGLISAHAALYQYQRKIQEDGGKRVVFATEEDYEAVYPLLGHVVDHVEEHLSPAAMELLQVLDRMGQSVVTIRSVQYELGWSYSKTYRTMGELVEVELVRADRHSAGTAKQFERAPYQVTGHGIRKILPPKGLV